MKSKSETGHAKNVAKFQDMIAYVVGYGAIYNPTKSSLKLPQLNALASTNETNLQAVIDKNTAYNSAVINRIYAFDNLKPLSTRLINALEATDATVEKVKDAKAYNRKIQGKRVGTAKPPTDPNTPAPQTISASQQSYDLTVQHLNGLISVLQSEPSYAPNEADLKITTLTAKSADMLAKNKLVDAQFTNISNARIARNKSLYAKKTGLLSVAKDVKKYVKSLFGFNSPEFKQISKIQFTSA